MTKKVNNLLSEIRERLGAARFQLMLERILEKINMHDSFLKESAYDDLNDFAKSLALDVGHDLLSHDKCDHGVSFDEKEAKTMSVAEIRHKFPRLQGECSKGCGFNGIAYASYAHYIYGDW